MTIDRKIARTLATVANALFFLTFLGVFTCVVIWGYTATPSKYNPNSPALHLTVIIGFVLITALFVARVRRQD